MNGLSLGLSLGRGGGANPFASLMSQLLSGASQLIAHPLAYGSMFQDRAGTTPVTAPGQLVGHVLDAGGGGYHATAISDAARGVYAVVPEIGRRNLLTYSEEFDNAVWSKINTDTIVFNAVGPDGEANSAVTLADNGSAGATTQVRAIVNATVSTSTPYTFSVFLKADQLSWAMLRVEGFTTPATSVVYFNLSAGVVGSIPAAFDSVNIENFGNGWYRCSVSFTTDAADTSGILGVYLADSDGDSNVDLDGTSSILIYGAQLEEGSTATAYQRVGSEFDVTEAGVPSLPYISYNGVNTAYSTPALPAPLVDKAQVFAGVRKLSDAAQGIVSELSPSIVTNNGAFALSAPKSAADNLAFESKGTTLQSAIASGYASPITNVLTGLGDISGDLATLRIDGTQVAQSTADQGTGNYNPSGTYPLYYGARGGTSLFFNGRHYDTLGPITRFSAANATTEQIEAAEAYYTARVI